MGIESHASARDAFARLFEREAPVIYAWAAARLRRNERGLAEDLVQTVWLKALNLFERFEGPESGFRNWVFAIAERTRLELMRELARSGGRGVAGSLSSCGSFDPERMPAEATSISSRLARDEQLQIFLDRVERLPECDRELLELRGFQELPWDEVARDLGLSGEAARQRYSRLLGRLREEGLPQWLSV